MLRQHRAKVFFFQVWPTLLTPIIACKAVLKAGGEILPHIRVRVQPIPISISDLFRDSNYFQQNSHEWG